MPASHMGAHKRMTARRPYIQILVVFIAFGVMILLCYPFMRSIVESHLDKEAKNTLALKEGRIDADLKELETMLSIISETIGDMLGRGAGAEEIKGYIKRVTGHMRNDEAPISGFISAFVMLDVFDGWGYNGLDMEMPEGYAPEDRLWFSAAEAAQGAVVVTAPYVDAWTGEVTITFARCLYDADGRKLATVCIDVTLDRIQEFMGASNLSGDYSYSLLLDDELYVLAHPDKSLVGKTLHELDKGFSDVEDLKQEITVHRVNLSGEQSILYAAQLKNGWHIFLVASVDKYYGDFSDIFWFLTVLGITLAALVSLILLRVVRARVRAEELTQIMFDATPLCINFWDKNMRNVNANDEAVKLFGLSDKQEYFDRFTELSPEYQPDGERSGDKGVRLVREAFDKGYCQTEWMHQKLNGEPLPCEVTFIRVLYKDGYAVAGYTRDLHNEKTVLDELYGEKAKSEAAAHWYKSILDAVPLPITVTDADMKWTFVNTAVEEFLGMKREDMMGRSCSNWDAEICGTPGCGIACAKRGLKQTYFKHNGLSFQVDVEILRSLEGETAGYIEIVQDITKIETLAKKQSETEETQRAFNTLKHVLNGLDALIYATDPTTGEILFINDNIIQYYELESDCVGKLCYKVFHKDKDAQCDFCPCRQLDKEPDKVLIWEEYSDRKKETYRHSERYIQWPDGSTVHLRHSVDITDLRNATAALDKRLEQQALMTYISQTFLSNEDMGVLIADALRKVGEFINVSMVLMYESNGDGKTFSCKSEWVHPDSGVPTQIGHIVPLSGDMIARLTEQKNLGVGGVVCLSSDIPLFRQLMAPYRAYYNNFLTTYIFLGDDLYAILDFSRGGDEPWTQSKIDMAKLFTNVLTGAAQKREVDRQLIAAKDLAEQNNRYKSTFLASMSHEIRTPLNAILGIAEIQLQEQPLSQEMEDSLNKIFDSGDLLLNIINDILDLSKIEANKLEILPYKYDIPSLIIDTVQLNRLRYESKPLDFQLQIDETTPLYLLGDELRIKQILNNLLSNAFKYTDEGEVGLSIAVEPGPGGAAPDDDDAPVTLVLQVRDTGQGMKEEEVQKLFDEYTRFNLEANRATVGTGLGMNITKRLLSLMDGEIQVESEPGRGSVFTVRLPQRRIGPEVCGPELVQELQQSRFQRILKTHKKQIIREYMPYGRILVVDDVESNLYVAKGLLQSYGLKIETVSSGFDAVHKVKNGHEYDIVFMDHMMPKMDGMEATKIIRGMGYAHPIVALTANTVIGQAETFLSNGFDGFISKPIDLRELNALLNDFVRDKQPPEVIEAARREKLEMAAPAQRTQQSNEVEAAFLWDAEKAVAVLEELYAQLNAGGDADIQLYTITVHGMKNALDITGEVRLSGFAYMLEQAGRDRDTALILEKTPEFINTLRRLIREIDQTIHTAGIDAADEDKAYLSEKMVVIRAACGKLDKKTAKTALEELKQKTWSRQTVKQIDAIASHLLHSAFQNASDIAEEIINT